MFIEIVHVCISALTGSGARPWGPGLPSTSEASSSSDIRGVPNVGA